MKSDYDVVVVGAGPAGSAVAKRCAEHNLSVVVFEKRAEVGSPKRCAEGITTKDEKLLKLNIPKSCINQEIDGAILIAPNGKKLVIDFQKKAGYVLERKVFDKWLASEAVNAGADVFAKTCVKSLTEDGVIIENDGEEKKIKCKLVIAADGVESKIARLAGLNTSNKLADIDSGYQYEMEGLKIEDPKKIYFWFGTEMAPRGYLWLFPKSSTRANVGIGVALCEKPAKYYLDKFISEKFPDASILEVNAGGVPVGGLLENMVWKNGLVVGDAAHQVNPIHGGGIKEAIYGGKLAGEIISSFLNNECKLEEYNKRWWEERGKYLKKLEKLREIFEKLSDQDLNDLMGALNPEDVIEIARGKRFSVLAKILMKTPGLVKFAKHLL